MPIVELRDTTPADVPALIAHQRDPAAARMAAFMGTDPNDGPAIEARWAAMLEDPDVVIRSILRGRELAGHVARFLRDGRPEITYWIGRRHWGLGVATAALRQFLAIVTERPLYAGAAADNHGSRRVLEKCGFVQTGTTRGWSPVRGEEVDEVRLVLR